MSRWIDSNLADRLYMVNHVSDSMDIDPESIEKDWWVTTVLKVLFDLSISEYTFFKGGTSLSKGWNLINRFSEDIDIALFREFFLKERNLSCARCENNNQIKMLRKSSRDFIHSELKTELEMKLKEAGLDVIVEAVTTHMTAEGEKPIDHDADRLQKIICQKPDIIHPREHMNIFSLISDVFGDDDGDTVTNIATISPSRTFLEKAFLLNEEYQRRNPRTLRMSRHLYDLEKLMDTDYAKSALQNMSLYTEIVEHRKKFYHVGGVDYSLDMPEKISFCPSGEILNRFRSDYENMKSSFIYGNPLDFDMLIKRLEELQTRFRQMKG